jgi:hypothetical protein
MVTLILLSGYSLSEESLREYLELTHIADALFATQAKFPHSKSKSALLLAQPLPYEYETLPTS